MSLRQENELQAFTAAAGALQADMPAPTYAELTRRQRPLVRALQNRSCGH